jgi:hypothetical protein
MEHIMQIQVRINEEGALRNQRYAFTDRFTLVSELLQNARRAGAMRIEIHYDATAQVLRVEDDGRGLDDFQKLLSFHESGWDAATSAEERPFGVGFSKCLYAATRCIVASNHQRVDIDTAAALAKASIEVESITEAVAGTRIELHGVDLPDLGNRIESLCLGFPVEVLFNGKPLLRRFAAAHLATMASPMGYGPPHRYAGRQVQLQHPGLPAGLLRHEAQLLPVRRGQCRAPGFAPVHGAPAGSRQVDRRGRTEKADRYRVEGLLAADARGRQDPAFARTLRRNLLRGDARLGTLDLLNDLDVLPAELFDEIVDYPIQDDDRSYVRQVAVAPTRQAVESGAVTLVSLDWLGDDNAARWMLARAKGYLVFDWIGLSSEHWAWRHVRFLDQETVQVEAVSEQIRVQLEGRWVWPTVILCESVILRSAKDVAEITDAGVCHGDVLYIPAGETSGEPVRQASSFIDENDQFLASDLDADRDALADLIRRLRSVDPVQTLDSLLQELRLGRYPLLHGKAFQVTVGVGAAPGHSVALVAEAGSANTGAGHAGS